MNSLDTGSVVLGLLLVGLTAAGGDESPRPSVRGPVVVELFTSQGCSSCPPADRLLSRLAVGELEVDGVEVVPLAFHVDYWNHLGWADPFSSASFSQRQRRYAWALEAGRVYTPQMVIDGAVHFVGSDEERLRREIEAAAREPATGEVALAFGRKDHRRQELLITARVRDGAAGESWRAMVAVFESGLVTSVPRGENAGRSLNNSGVVRRLIDAFSLPGRGGAARTEKLEIELEEGWERRHLGVAVFLQDPATLRIHGAAVRPLGA